MIWLHFITQFFNYNGQSFGWTPFVIDAKVEYAKYMGQNEVLFGTCCGTYWELAKHVANNILGVKYCQNEKNKNKREYFVNIFLFFLKSITKIPPQTFFFFCHIWILISNWQHFFN
jgi:hypothetical protein